MRDRAELMKVYINNGVKTLPKMKGHYNSFADGGHLGGAHGEVPFTTNYSTVPQQYKKTITLDNLHELAKDNPAMYKKYMQQLPKEYQSRVIENAARSRYGYEGLNEAMLATTGGLPGVLGDVAGRVGSKIGEKASDLIGLDQDSYWRKGIELGTGIGAGLFTGYKTAAQDIGSWLNKGSTRSMTHRPSFPTKKYKLFNSPIEREVRDIVESDFPLIYVDEARRSRVMSGAYDRVAASHGFKAPKGADILTDVNDTPIVYGTRAQYNGSIILPRHKDDLAREGITNSKQLKTAFTHEAGHKMTDFVGLRFSMQPKDWPTFLDESKIKPSLLKYLKGDPLNEPEDWDELIQRVAQVKDNANITDGKQLLSGDELKSMFHNYTSDPTNSQNQIKEVEEAVTNWDDFAKWANKFVPVLGLGVGVGSKEFRK